jgi:hypothetical protein
MRVETWAPGTNAELDQLFDSLRDQRYQDRTHRMWKNYSQEAFADVGSVALTIYFDDQGQPEMCSTISSRACWPVGAYRILNRLWKHNNKIVYPRVISPSFEHSLRSQISWLKNNTECKMYFISRQTENWEHWCIREFRKQFDLEFATDNYRYLTCQNECDDSCWQKIIYSGDAELLTEWKRK